MVNKYSVNILGLSKGIHTFEFQLGEDFFEKLGRETAETGNLAVKVILDKRETFIEAEFTITGSVRLICDRSLDEFDYPITLSKKVVFKYGEKPQEISDEIIIIQAKQAQLELGQLMYEFISLEIPMKKLHPRFIDETSDDSMVYSSKTEDEKIEPIDPRWEKLKKLK
ncbi:MAG: hypothetical protein OJF59_003139 [Cytophagales bacterium]|jgi:uncharacterized metal-binding protein YceD (DUF177 family)|nr:DUF177 domain-containing protein [Bacteroidota bacterium]MBS1981934.1 DUF177 domain-containing protein [Bacteroidota bacterium]WHZ09383.1 MAG: hypothetical protein OJF59_003139 [Cytophagales bacterium]